MRCFRDRLLAKCLSADEVLVICSDKYPLGLRLVMHPGPLSFWLLLLCCSAIPGLLGVLRASDAALARRPALVCHGQHSLQTKVTTHSPPVQLSYAASGVDFGTFACPYGQCLQALPQHGPFLAR